MIALWYLFKRLENLCPQKKKNMRKDVFEALFITAKTCRQTRCSSVDE